MTAAQQAVYLTGRQGPVRQTGLEDLFRKRRHPYNLHSLPYYASFCNSLLQITGNRIRQCPPNVLSIRAPREHIQEHIYIWALA